MEDAEKGSQERLDSAPEVGEDAVTSVGPSPPPPPAITEEERQELQEELDKVEDEIQTLSQVLAAKEKQLADIKRKLGVTALNELKQNITKTWQEVTTSIAYRRTSETLSQASLKATAAFSNMGSAISRKLEDVSTQSLQHSASMPAMRNAPTFKSFEDKVETLKVTTANPPRRVDEAVDSSYRCVCGPECTTTMTQTPSVNSRQDIPFPCVLCVARRLHPSVTQVKSVDLLTWAELYTSAFQSVEPVCSHRIIKYSQRRQRVHSSPSSCF
ncbi:tumor protein D52 isoform X1 [Embiotoca jacksoni]|uniref:tumor protein D52 isoform X1 n=1 Tax=Embiotoca jacksoni TaxID=100190 RepID=UPI003703FF04